MKSRKLFRAVLAAVAIAAIFPGCSNLFDKDDDSTAITESSQKGRLLFSVDSSARAVSTINPTGFDFASDSGLTFTLTGTLNGTSQTLGTWSDSSDTKAYALMTADSSILVDTGSWTFRLSVATSSGEVLYGLLEKSIVAGNNTLDFGTLSEASSTDTTRDSTVSVAKGSVNVTLSFPADSTALGATATLTAIGKTAGDAASLEITTSDTTSSVTYTASDVSAGNYILAIKLYSDAETKDSTTYLNTYTAVVKVAPGQQSTGSAELTDLNKLCTITYELNGGSFDEEALQATYNNHAKITLPTPKLSGYNFLGWSLSSVDATTADYSDGETILISKNITLYALWELITVDASSAADFISNLTEDSTVYVTGELTEKLLSAIASAIKSGSYKVTLDLSGTTGLTTISDADDADSGIFSSNTNLSGIALPNSLTYIGSYAFYGCTSLTSIAIPDNVTSIGKCSFRGCTKLMSVTMPDKLTSIGISAFCGCLRITSITIPDKVTKIGGYAFDNCVSLESVTIGDSVETIGWYAFYKCSSLVSAIFTDTETWYRSSPSDEYHYYESNSFSSTELADTAKAAKYLREYYSTYYWYKN